jgi:hypothetical protein
MLTGQHPPVSGMGVPPCRACLLEWTKHVPEGCSVQLAYLPVEERFYVKINEDACALYPAGAFSIVANYPVYALRLRTLDGEEVTEFFIPGSDGEFVWMDMRRTRLARR